MSAETMDPRNPECVRHITQMETFAATLQRHDEVLHGNGKEGLVTKTERIIESQRAQAESTRENRDEIKELKKLIWVVVGFTIATLVGVCINLVMAGFTS